MTAPKQQQINLQKKLQGLMDLSQNKELTESLENARYKNYMKNQNLS